MDRMKLYGDNASSLGTNSPQANGSIAGSDGNHFERLVHPSSSPRYMKSDKLDIKDIPGSQSTTNGKQKKFQGRDHINVNDINDEAHFYKLQQVINKNDNLLTDDVLGRKKLYNKNNNSPLDPKYIVATKSRRMMVIGDIDGGKPKQFVQKD